MMASRSLLSASLRLSPVWQRTVIPSVSSRSMTVLSKQSGEEFQKKNYKERMEVTGRPVSPHVQIYKFPLIVFSSGFNRVTGVLITLGASGLGALEIFGGTGAALNLMELIGSQNMAVSSFFKFGVSFNILYHYGGGIRHLVWDHFPQYLNNEQGEKSAYALIGSVTAASIGLALV